MANFDTRRPYAIMRITGSVWAKNMDLVSALKQFRSNNKSHPGEWVLAKQHMIKQSNGYYAAKYYECDESGKIIDIADGGRRWTDRGPV